MRILGIDPGSTLIGYGVIEYEKGRFKCLDFGVIRNPGKDKSFNLLNTHKLTLQLIDKFKPQKAGIEKLFFQNNQKTAMAVSETRGVLLHAMFSRGIDIVEFTPLQVKQNLSGYGRAGKAQVQTMVRAILGIKTEIKPDDAADALAIAICATSTS